jgi:tetratricopeptide (TPR) repeat protein
MNLYRLPEAIFLSSALLSLGGLGCGPSPDAPLPPEKDLYAYSLAVVEKAALKAPGQKAKALFFTGRVHQRFGLEDKALELFRQALKVNPHLGNAYRQMGYIFSQRKDQMEEAVKAYNQVLRCEPELPGIYTRLGLIFTHQNQLEKAMQALNEEIRLGTASEETYYNLGYAFSLGGKHVEAIENYREAIRRLPSLRTAHYGLVQSLRALGKGQEAEEAQKRFLELKKKEEEEEASSNSKDNRKEQLHFAAEAWTDAGEIFLGEASSSDEKEPRSLYMKELVHALEEAIRLDPAFTQPRKSLVDYYRSLEDLDSAAKVCEGALKAVPPHPALAPEAYQLAMRFLEQVQKNEAPREKNLVALELLKSAAHVLPSFPDAHRDIAKLILFRLKDRMDLRPQALEHALKAVEQKDEAFNYNLLAFAYHQNGRIDLAKEAFEEGLRHHPDDPGLTENYRKLLEREQ